MANPWARLEIGYLNHPKFIALNSNAICLWHEGKAYCDRHHTDGLIPRDALKTFRFRGVKAMGLLTAPCPMLKPDGTPYAPLWEAHAIGFIMHDYLDHNDCREEILDRISNADLKRDRDRRRMQLWRDKELIAQIRARDGDCCRYCHRAVDWADRRGAYGATYDHINPEGENTLENLVVACRGCNSVKGNKSLAVAGMTLLQPKQVSTARSKSVVEMSQATSRGSRAETETETETETSTDLKRGGEQTPAAPPRPMAPIHTSHKKHVVCGRVCLHEAQFDEFVRRRSGDREGVRSWASGVIDEWNPGAAHGDDEPGDVFDFWRARYAEQWPTSGAATKSSPASRQRPSWATPRGVPA